MAYTVVFFTLLLHLLHHQPALLYPQSPIRIPQLIVSPAEEVNSLTSRQHHTRSISPSINLSTNKIEETVKQVEAMIKSNPALPRLTRGEILDLLENITTTDQKKFDQNRDSKAIMVVMPFTPTNGDNRNMEELYTKAPVTHIIGAEPFKVNQEVVNRIPQKTRRRPTTATQYGVKKTELTQTPKPVVIEQKVSPVPPKQRRRRPELTTEKVTTTTYRLRGRRRSTTATTPKPVTTIITKHPNHRYPEDETTTEFGTNHGGLRIIKPPQLSPPVPAPQQINQHIADLSVEENMKQEVVYKQQVPVAQKIVKTTTPRALVNEIVTRKYVQRTTTPSAVTQKPVTTTTTQTPKPLIDQMNLPNNLKKVVQDLNLDGILSEEELEAKYPKPKRTTTTAPTTTWTSTTSIPDVSYVADNLSPEMRDLLMSFGLIPNPNEPKPSPPGPEDVFIPDKAEVKPESYVGFKPLPEDGPSREGMDALLASFGLGRSARKEKAIPTKTRKEKDGFEVVPEDYRDVLSDLGLRESRKIRTQTANEGKVLDKQHIFDPNTQYASDDELEKLNKLINSIRELEKLNRTATDEELKTVDLKNLKELITTLNNSTKNLATLDEIRAPDPNQYDAGLIRNEVKRQEENTTSATNVVVVAVTEEPRSPSLADLEASFGGQTSTEAPTTTPAAETTTTLRTGFYYLVDWNSFLDIDDQKGRRVNLRFQPTVGDPKRFLSVSVP